MWQQGGGTRYAAGQLVEATGRARGEGRFFLMDALCYFPGLEREDGLAHILDEADLRPYERHMVLATQVQCRHTRPSTVRSLFESLSLRRAGHQLRHDRVDPVAHVRLGHGNRMSRTETVAKKSLGHPDERQTSAFPTR